MTQIGAFSLRPYQEKMVTDVRWAASELKQAGKPVRILVQACCGAGKTIVSCAIMKGAIDKGNRWGFIVRGRQLVDQKSERLTACMIPHSILMDGYEYHQSAVTVCSVDSYRSRVIERQIVPAVDPNGWNIDEAHLFQSDGQLAIVQSADVCIGFTATPIGREGRGMGGFWQKLVKGPTHAEMIRLGQLVPCKVFAPYMPDLSQLKIQDGDWSKEAVAEVMNKKELIGDILQHWKRLAHDRPTVGFASSVEHSIALRDEFNAAGIPSAHIDADTSTEDRRKIIEDWKCGKILVVWNFWVFGVGADFPWVSCGVMAFATASLQKLLQATGRCFRPFAGKADCILIDHGGNVHRHGWPQEDREWTLDTTKTIQEIDIERRERDKTPREPICCPKCGAMRQSGPKCVNCGHEHKRTGLKVRMADGTLTEVKRSKPKRQVTDVQKAWMQILAVCAYRNLPCSAASAMFKNKTGDWPEKSGVSPLTPWEKRGLLVKNVYPGFIKKKQETVQ